MILKRIPKCHNNLQNNKKNCNVSKVNKSKNLSEVQMTLGAT